MPKTTKRAATKRAARVARAHASDYQRPEVKDPTARRRSPGYKPPARGIARYPWATGIIVALIALGVLLLFLNHLWPFTYLNHSTVTSTKPATTNSATLRTGASPCTDSAILSKITASGNAPTTDEFNKTTHSYPQAPAMSIDKNKLYCAGLNTNQGLIVVELDPKIAPETVNNFVFLANHQYYDGTIFHRVIQDTPANAGQLHIIQGGDAQYVNQPDKLGQGGPGYKFNDEPVKGEYVAGSLAMANSGANTNGSQFFINVTDNKTLPKSYNLFGRVVQGMDVVKKVEGPNENDKNTKANTTIGHVVVVPAS
ncbi:peptidylprolyl isomerase [Tengunoibacter tsumagoiensis]|uniref:peptidylprolyl isomerase n=1 Tax=Tengunoibacter tsumagoiensis TaxID=2014871 RepID=A0A401ZWI5_9CHLR|nr:peptidylprolyl isomerase [Tengunoibacter tsumagoiensis]GCE11233.1 hypothetical protein KTT_10920 [Tengunoibacter tsumagoiensis]